jgi:protein disulfide-isomerase A6
MIAKVDAEAGNSKSVAKQERIQGYPTIRFYPRKSIEFKEYGRERSEEAFVEYLNEMSGTSRAVGGGLTPKAGTIEKLNTLVDKFVGGEKIAKVAKEIEKAAKGLEDKYAAYYVKAAGKLKDNADYATKELARLERMLGKGNLAGEKMDDLQSRSNILRRFLGIKTEEPEATEEKTGKDEL